MHDLSLRCVISLIGVVVGYILTAMLLEGTIRRRQVNDARDVRGSSRVVGIVVALISFCLLTVFNIGPLIVLDDIYIYYFYIPYLLGFACGLPKLFRTMRAPPRRM